MKIPESGDGLHWPLLGVPSKAPPRLRLPGAAAFHPSSLPCSAHGQRRTALSWRPYREARDCSAQNARLIRATRRERGAARRKPSTASSELLRAEPSPFESAPCDTASPALVRRLCPASSWALSSGFALGLKSCLKLLDTDMNFCWACPKSLSEDLRAAGVRGVMLADGAACPLPGVVYQGLPQGEIGVKELGQGFSCFEENSKGMGRGGNQRWPGQTRPLSGAAGGARAVRLSFCVGSGLVTRLRAAACSTHQLSRVEGGWRLGGAALACAPRAAGKAWGARRAGLVEAGGPWHTATWSLPPSACPQNCPQGHRGFRQVWGWRVQPSALWCKISTPPLMAPAGDAARPF